MIPKQYLQGLDKEAKEKQTSLINESKAEYERNGTVTDRPRVSEAATPRSSHARDFQRIYGFTITNRAAVQKMFPDTDIRRILGKGAAAYASGSRPNVSFSQWAHARLASVLTGGPALNIDKSLVGPVSLRIIKSHNRE